MFELYERTIEACIQYLPSVKGLFEKRNRHPFSG